MLKDLRKGDINRLPVAIAIVQEPTRPRKAPKLHDGTIDALKVD